jgi:hypothetical protein
VKVVKIMDDVIYRIITLVLLICAIAIVTLIVVSALVMVLVLFNMLGGQTCSAVMGV